MLYTKCILKEREKADGWRISIMSRHTLNDGITPDSRIPIASYDQWIKELAPPEKLIGAYYKMRLSWKEFEEGYLEHIRSKGIKEIVQELSVISTFKNITLLCIEEYQEFCHRRILANECIIYQPWLSIEHKS